MSQSLVPILKFLCKVSNFVGQFCLTAGKKIMVQGPQKHENCEFKLIWGASETRPIPQFYFYVEIKFF